MRSVLQLRLEVTQNSKAYTETGIKDPLVSYYI
jgi:hypothetical protein